MITLKTGGQTGVDQGAAAAALALGVPVSGFAYGRDGHPACEDGPIGDWLAPHLGIWPGGPMARTEINVRRSSAILVVTADGRATTPGTLATLRLAQRWRVPAVVVELRTASAALTWLRTLALPDLALNVAGPRATLWPEAFDTAHAVTTYILKGLL